jgi:hypothetical protein
LAHAHAHARAGRGPTVTAPTYPVWGWGGPDQEPDPAALEALAPVVQALLGFGLQAPERPRGVPEVGLMTSDR